MSCFKGYFLSPNRTLPHQLSVSLSWILSVTLPSTIDVVPTQVTFQTSTHPFRPIRNMMSSVEPWLISPRLLTIASYYCHSALYSVLCFGTLQILFRLLFTCLSLLLDSELLGGGVGGSHAYCFQGLQKAYPLASLADNSIPMFRRTV